MELAIIADQDTVTGFQLCGVADSAVYDEKTLAASVQAFHDASLLIVTEEVGKKIRELNLDQQIKGLLLDIPSKQGSSGDITKEINKLFESAIGVKLK